MQTSEERKEEEIHKGGMRSEQQRRQSLLHPFLSFFALSLLLCSPFPRGGKQPWFQLASIVVTLGFALVGGIIVGVLMRLTRHIYKSKGRDGEEEEVEKRETKGEYLC